MRGVNWWDKRVCAFSTGLITLGGGLITTTAHKRVYKKVQRMMASNDYSVQQHYQHQKIKRKIESRANKECDHLHQISYQRFVAYIC